MSDEILLDHDTVIFLPTFGAATVVVRPGKIKASGPATIKGKKMCVTGDEKSVAVPGCMYTTPAFPIPGTGTLKIARLASNQIAKKTDTGDKAVLLRGAIFQAAFEVQSPARQPPNSNAPDPAPKYSGQGYFVTTNHHKCQGT